MLFQYDISLIALSPTRSPRTGANSFLNIGLRGSYPYALSLVPLVCIRFPTVALDFLILDTLSQRFPPESFSRSRFAFASRPWIFLISLPVLQDDNQRNDGHLNKPFQANGEQLDCSCTPDPRRCYLQPSSYPYRNLVPHLVTIWSK